MHSETFTSRAAQALQTRELLVRTAERLFAKRGYDATSLQAIADEVGLTKAAVYYHFKTKAQLFEAVTHDAQRRLIAIAEETSRITSRNERIGYFIEAILDLLVAHRQNIELTRRDPVLYREKEFKAGNDALHAQMLRALYGDTPTTAEQAAYHLLTAIADVVGAMSGCSDGELRSVLGQLCRRVLTVPEDH